MVIHRGNTRSVVVGIALLLPLLLPPAVVRAQDPAPPPPAPSPSNSVVVVRPHARATPELSISEVQEQLLDRIDSAIVRADADKNPILAQATIVPSDMVERKITDLAIGARLAEDLCAEGLARSLDADSYLRIEVVSIEGPLTDVMVAPPTEPVAPPAPPPEPPLKDEGRGKGRKKGASEKSPPAPSPSVTPVVLPAGEVRWTVRYRFTLLPAEGGAVPPEDFTIEREVEGVIRNAARSHVIALLERLKNMRAVGFEQPGRAKWIGLGVAGLVVGAAAAGAGAYLLSINGNPTEPLLPPAEHTRQRYATILPGAIAVGGGALALIGGVVALARGLRGERPPAVQVGPVCTVGGGGGLAVSGSF